MRLRSSLPATILLASAAGRGASADTWLTAEAPAAIAVSDAQEGVFRPGAMPAVGVYASNERIALGLRMRAGILRNGPAPGDNFADPGTGGLATGGLAMRFLVGHAWSELVVGGGVTGRDLVPAVELGVGFGVDIGRLTIGPSARYVHIYARDPMDTLGSAGLVLVGVDVKVRRDKPVRVNAFVAHRPPPPPPPPVHIDDDNDQVVEHEDSCAQLLDGCPIADAITIHDYRIVLDDRVLFDFNKSRVRSRGREMVATIAKAWHAHPEWRRITIEGHADVRGSDDYNLQLSQLRADHVRDVLVKQGFDADAIDAVGYGRSQPRDTGSSEAAHQRNRRVEFLIDCELASHRDAAERPPTDEVWPVAGGAR
jgi:outer membrane protein OmpA-like peptidoglycan-associated protein